MRLLTSVPFRAACMMTTAVIALAGQASAQSTAPSAQQPAGANPEQAAQVDEVIVTAQRRQERLQDVPAAISAQTGEQLERLGVTNTTELTRITPGLNFTQSVYSAQPTIRGIGVRGVGAGDESVVPIYIDGVYQSFIPGAQLQFNSVERVEVLKGPQGALLGRNATGGAINIITLTPGEGFEGAASVRYGNFNSVLGKLYVAGGSDTLAASLAIVANSEDGYIRDRLRDEDYGSSGFAARAKLVWTPSDAFDLTFSASGSNTVDSSPALTPVNNNTVGVRVPGNVITTDPFEVNLSFRPYFKVNQESFSLTGRAHLGWADLTVITSYQNAKMANMTDSDGTPAPIAVSQVSQYSENSYNEAYLVSTSDGPFDWIVGGVYYHDDSGNYPFSSSTQRSVSLAGVLGNPVVTTRTASIITDSYAAYAQGTYHFNDQWSATLGGRYTTETKEFVMYVNQSPTPLSSTPREATFSKFTPSLTIQFQPNDDYNFYAKIGQAFKAGIFNAGATTNAGTNPVDPETVTQYELGLKADFSPSLRLNLSTYFTDYQDLQVTSRDPVSLASTLLNAGAAELYGVEADLQWRPTDLFTLRWGVSAMHAEYTDFQAAQVFFPAHAVNPPAANPCQEGSGPLIGGNISTFCNVTGNKLIRTPFLQSSLNGDYRIPTDRGDWLITGNVSYVGKSYWDVGNRFEEPARVTISGRVKWTHPDGRYGVALWGDNLTDEYYRTTTSVSSLYDAELAARPRSYGIELMYNW